MLHQPLGEQHFLFHFFVLVALFLMFFFLDYFHFVLTSLDETKDTNSIKRASCLDVRLYNFSTFS